MPWPPAKAAWSRPASVLDHLSLRGDLQRALREGIAEEFGLIVDIGQWVLETSATQVA
jgi:EAL domain-containing protein (putative c-di-GMP-specific phosphodiesterase class I)